MAMINTVERLISARLQTVEFSPTDGLFLEFYMGAGQRRWARLNTSVELFEVKPALQSRPITKPLTLFLRSHFVGHALDRIEEIPSGDVRLYFPKERHIEIKQEAGGVQVRAWAEGKSVMLKMGSVGGGHDSKKKETGEPTLQKQLAKLQRALKKVEQELASKRDQMWSRVGEWLLAAQTLDGAPAEFVEYLDFTQSFAWNINHCFEKSKQIKAKVVGTQKRRDEIAKQIVEINAGNKTLHSKKENLLVHAKSQGRTFPVGGHLFFVGKSAEDNLRILRAAKPWHLWFHLKDYPGSHGILQINKGERVSESMLHEAAQFLLKAQFGDKASRHAGDKFDILVAECRYVRPIRGDRLGRVNYSQARTIIHKQKC